MFSPFKDVFVHYRITNMTWTPDHVMFSAKASFAAQQVMFNFDFMTVYYTSSVNFANFFVNLEILANFVILVNLLNFVILVK